MERTNYKDNVPTVRAEKVDEVVQLGWEYMERCIPDRTPRMSLLRMQLRYVSAWFWLAQLLLIVVTVVIGITVEEALAAAAGAEARVMAGRLLFQLAPVLCLTAVPEMVKDIHYDMSELENCCKNDSSMVLQMRLLIVGLTDIVTLTLLAVMAAESLQQDFLVMVVYGLVPFMWVSAVNLVILRTLRIRGRLGGVFLTLLPLALSWVVPLWDGAFEGELMMLWTAALAAGTALLATELVIINREMVREGVNQWN